MTTREPNKIARFREQLEAGGRYPSWVLATCLAGMAATTFTITILGVSLSTIARDLDADVATIAGILTTPMLAQALSLPLLGKLGDLYGHRRVYLIGFVFAIVAAVATAFAWNPTSLISFRTFAQLAGTATMPASMALLYTVFAPHERVKAMGWVSLVTAGAPVFGLALGGVLVDAVGWRPIFLIQAGLSVVAWGLAIVVLRETEPQRDVRLDLPGAITLSIAAFSLNFAITKFSSLGMSDPRVLTSFALAPAALLAFVFIERRVEHPLIPLHFFKRRNFVIPMIAGGALQFAYMGGFIISPLLLENVYLMTTGTIAIWIALRPLSFSAASPIGSRIAMRIGERWMANTGAVCIVVAMLAFAWASAGTSMLMVCVGLVVAGLGFGAFQPSISAILGNAVDDKNFGIASSAMQMTSSIGAAAGIGLLTALCASDPSPETYRHGYLLGAAVALFGLVATAFLSPSEVVVEHDVSAAIPSAIEQL